MVQENIVGLDSQSIAGPPKSVRGLFERIRARLDAEAKGQGSSHGVAQGNNTPSFGCGSMVLLLGMGLALPWA